LYEASQVSQPSLDSSGTVLHTSHPGKVLYASVPRNYLLVRTLKQSPSLLPHRICTMVAETTAVWPYTHQPPLFSCAPGEKDNCPQDVQNTFIGGSDNPVPWPVSTHIRVKVMPVPNESCDPYILAVVKAQLWAYLKDMSPLLSAEHVKEDADAEVRISFNTAKPNWSAMGPRALKYPQAQPTMNFNFGGGPESKTIYSIAQISRVAAHLFGHALGL
jgi:hypothetical protein